MSENKNKYIYVPFLLAVAICIGIFVGVSFKGSAGIQQRAHSSNKIDYLLNMIDMQYVDTISSSKLIEDAIPTIVNELDPHSVYIPAKDLQSTNEELEGSFSGIGVQFNIQNDTVMVVSVIPGGPSEKIGLFAGDRIVAINDSAFVGKDVTNERVMEGYEIVIEATGSETGIIQALSMVRKKGTIILKSTYAGNTIIPMSTIVVNEITIIGSRCGPFIPALSALSEKRVKFPPIKLYRLEEYEKAFCDTTFKVGFRIEEK